MKYDHASYYHGRLSLNKDPLRAAPDLQKFTRIGTDDARFPVETHPYEDGIVFGHMERLAAEQGPGAGQYVIVRVNDLVLDLPYEFNPRLHRESGKDVAPAGGPTRLNEDEARGLLQAIIAESPGQADALQAIFVRYFGKRAEV